MKSFISHIKRLDCMSMDKNVFFSIRFFGKLFSEATGKHRDRFKKAGIVRLDGKPLDFRKWFVAWVRQIIENVVFHTVRGDYRLSEIDGLKSELSTKRAWIVDKKDKRIIPLLSEGPSGMDKMKVDVFCTIHLNHSECMEDMLTRLESALVIMRMLTDNIKASAKGQTLTGNGKEIALDSYSHGFPAKLVGWYYRQVDRDFIAPLLPHLCTELKYIAAAMHLTAMSAAHNLKKH